MTILTKPILAFKKPDSIQSPLVDENGPLDEEKVDVYPPGQCPHVPRPPPRRRAKRSSGALLCMTVVALLVAITGSICGLMLYRQYLRSTVHRYQAYCSIPIDIRELIMQEAQEAQEAKDQQLIEQDYNEHRFMPLRWSTEPDDVQVFSTVDDIRPDALVNLLREEFDIHGPVEKVRVFDKGHTIMFIHDFSENLTGIVDDDRCFLMDLDMSFTLTPEVMVLSMENGSGQFEVSPVHSAMRAVLPALQEMQRYGRVLEDRCVDKPTYRLHKEDVVIRKRSVEAPKRDYIQFAGKHVQEISIANLAELQEYEKKVKG